MFIDQVDLNFYIACINSTIRKKQIDTESSILIIIIQISDYFNIRQLNPGPSEKGYIPVHAAKTPKILVFEVTAVTPAVDFNSYVILSNLKPISDIKFGSCFTPLAISYVFTVYPQKKCRPDSTEMDIYFMIANPVFVQLNFLFI